MRDYSIKKEPEDFVVEEITPSGRVLEAGAEEEFKESSGEYLIFVLEKKKWTTTKALKELKKRLGVSRKRLSYAGTKDKQAITTQRASAWNISKEQLGTLGVKDITLKPLKKSDKEVTLGDLKGNRFTVKATGVQEIFEKDFYPNYFGEQRFGNRRPLTHLVGKKIVRERFEDAVWMYLTKTFEDRKKTESQKAIDARNRLAEERDVEAALDYFPKYLDLERTLLGHLNHDENDFVGALRKLPRNLCLLFVHAYQSYLFNKVLRKRLKKGMEEKEGDILRDDVPTGALFGYECELAGGVQGEIEESVLEEEWVDLNDFRIHGVPELSSRGERRKLFLELSDLKVLEELGNGFVVRFSLGKGCYATVVLDLLFGEGSELVYCE